MDAGRLSAAPISASELLNALGGSSPVDGGRVTLAMPEIAEDGSVVPLTVSVDSPMTEATTSARSPSWPRPTPSRRSPCST